MKSNHAAEVKAGGRFEFGENWARFLSELSEEKILSAIASLREMLGVESLEGKTFLDAGSGSGLFSLAAFRLGADVVSFDFDPASVGCTRRLKDRFAAKEAKWTVLEGSVLDEDFMASLGCFDVVYSWGVLHHTGQMHLAFANAADRVAPAGALFIAIYNDQGWGSGYWAYVKRAYNHFPLFRPLLILVHTPYLIGVRWIVRMFAGHLKLERGMSLWYDMVDWMGGYPFEVARPEVVFRFFRDRGFSLGQLTTCGGRMGCNEFVFWRTGA